MKNKIILFLLIFFLISGLRAGENQGDTEDQGKAKPTPKVGRAWLEMGLNIAFSTVNYWNKYWKFQEDWQFELTWKDQKLKFFSSEGLRLDSNNLSSAAGLYLYCFQTRLNSWICRPVFVAIEAKIIKLPISLDPTGSIIPMSIAWTRSDNVSILSNIIDTLFFRVDDIDMSAPQQFVERHI